MSSPSARTLLMSTGLAVLLAAGPAFAQTTTTAPVAPTAAGQPVPAKTAPAMSTPVQTAPAPTAPAMTMTKTESTAPKGSLKMSHGGWRSSQLVGASVYNATGDSIGTVDDIIVGSTGKMSNAVLSVGGFLGMGDKLVEVPFSKLKIEPSKANPESGSGDTSNGNRDYSLVLPSATKASLKTMTAFQYDMK